MDAAVRGKFLIYANEHVWAYINIEQHPGLMTNSKKPCILQLSLEIITKYKITGGTVVKISCI